jgi:hypothetical protein
VRTALRCLSFAPPQNDPQLLITSLSVHRLLVTAVLVAAKFLDDSYFNNAYYSKARATTHPVVAAFGGGARPPHAPRTFARFGRAWACPLVAATHRAPAALRPPPRRAGRTHPRARARAIAAHTPTPARSAHAHPPAVTTPNPPLASDNNHFHPSTGWRHFAGRDQHA